MSRTTDYIAELLDQFEPVIRAAFLAALDDVRSNAELLRIIERLEKGDINGALEAVHLDPAAFRPLEQAMAQAYEAGGGRAVGSMPMLRDPAGNRVVVRFDGRNVRAETWLRNHSTSIVTGIVEDQAVAIRGALAAGMERGDNPRTVALDVVGRLDRRTGKRTGGIVGLTAQQVKFVENARAELREGTPATLQAYLGRQRRDKRFDRAVTKAIREGKPIPADQVAAMTQRYSDSLLKLRGDTIARTEAMASLHSAQDEAFRQAVGAGGVQEQNVRRVWRSAMDGRVRDSHRHLNGESVGLNEVFRTPSGALLRYPGDPSAPVSEIANCRCTLQVRIDFLSNLKRPSLNEDDEAALLGLAQRAETEVRDKGRAENLEFATGYDERTGKTVETVRGQGESVVLSDEMSALARDPNAKLVLFHNHPDDSSLSRQDLLLLASSPGLKRLHAVGNAGSSYSAQALKPLSDTDYADVRSQVVIEVKKAVARSGFIQGDAINVLMHTINLTLADLGFIDYRAKLKSARKDAYDRNADLLGDIVRTVVSRLK